MKKFVIYEAFDGTQFETEEECMEYEEMRNNVFGYDRNGELITDYDSILTLVDESQFLKVTSEKALKALQEQCGQYTHSITVGSLHVYSVNEDTFISVERQTYKLREMIEELENIKKETLSN